MCKSMNTRTHLTMVAALLTMLLVGFQAPVHAASIEIILDVTPNTINLQNNAQIIGAHTNIAYIDVDVSSVTLNDVTPTYCAADDQGFFYAKFNVSDFDPSGFVINALNDFVLRGRTVSGDFFSGVDQVMVIDKGQ